MFQLHEHMAKCLFKDYVQHIKGTSYVVKNYHELSLLINSELGDENGILTQNQIPKAKIASEVAHHLFYNTSNPYQVFKGLKIFRNCKSEFIDQQNFLIDNCNQVMKFIFKLIKEKGHGNANFLWNKLGENLREIANTYYDIKNQKFHQLLTYYASNTVLVYNYIADKDLHSDVANGKKMTSFTNFTNLAYPLLYSQIVFLLTRPELNLNLLFELVSSLIGHVDEHKMYQQSYLNLIKNTFGPHAETFIKNIFDRKGEATQLKRGYDDQCEEHIQAILSKFKLKLPNFFISGSEFFYPQYNDFLSFIIEIYSSTPKIGYEICMGAYREFHKQFECLPHSVRQKFEMTKIENLITIMPLAVQLGVDERKVFSQIVSKFFSENYENADGLIAAIQEWQRNLKKVGLENEVISMINSDLMKVLFNTPGFMQTILDNYMEEMLSDMEKMFVPMPAAKYERSLHFANIILHTDMSPYCEDLQKIPLWIWYAEILTQEGIVSEGVKNIIFEAIVKYFTFLIDKTKLNINDKRFNKSLVFENLVKILNKIQLLPYYNTFLVQIINLYAQLFPLIQNELEGDVFLLQLNDLYNLKTSKQSGMCHSAKENLMFDVIDCYSNLIMGLDLHMLNLNNVVNFKKYNMFKEIMHRSPTRIFHMFEMFKNQIALNQFEPQFSQFMLPDSVNSIAKFNSMKITSDNTKDTFIKWCGEEIFMVQSSYSYSEGFKINITNALINYFDLILQDYKSASAVKRKEMHAFLSKILNNVMTTISLERKLLSLLINKLKLLS